MADHPQDNELTGDVDFETALHDPAAFYAEPELVIADSGLTARQKRRFLTDWAQDIEDRQAGVGEGMDAALSFETDRDGQRLQRIRASLAGLPDDEPDAPDESLVRRAWRRLVQS